MEEKWILFVKSQDFLRLGQTLAHGQWPAARMALRKLEVAAKEAECKEFDLQFNGLKYAIQKKDKQTAMQVMTLIANKRAKIWNSQ